MQIDLSQKLALVTGSTAGIGFAIAKGLADSGAAVILNGRTQFSVDAAVEKIKKLAPGVEVRGVAADVGKAEDCARLVAAEPQIDILVNNAGVYGLRDFFDTPDSEWRRYTVSG